MIVYYLGIPGSGKSYSGVNTIYNNFSNEPDAKRDLKKDYHNCYTNINEFHFDKVKNVENLDFNILYKHLTKLHSMYKCKASDEELIEKAKEFNIYRTLFVIDECHNYLDSNDSVLVWWFTYHRHLYHDIFLITQNLSLVNPKYKPLAEAFYKAKSSSLSLNKKYFYYMYYTESRMNKNSYVNTIKVKKEQKVFSLYSSGDSVESKNVIMRFVYIAVFLFIVLLIMGYIFYKNTMPESKQKSSSIPASSVTISQNNEADDSVMPDYDDSVYMRFLCDVEMCTWRDEQFDIKLLAFARENFNLQIISSRRVFSESIVSVTVNRSFISFIQGVANDENTLEISSINPFNSGSK